MNAVNVICIIVTAFALAYAGAIKAETIYYKKNYNALKWHYETDEAVNITNAQHKPLRKIPTITLFCRSTRGHG